LSAAALVALSPHLFRLALTTPVLVDEAALFLGLVWCLLATASVPSLRWLSPLVVLLVIPTREAWVLPLLLATAVLWSLGERRLATATVISTLAASAFTFTQPTSSVGPWAHFSTMLKVLHDGRESLTHPDQAIWVVFFGVGFTAFLALLVLVRRQRLRGPTGVVVAVACGQLVQSPLSGVDSRYAAAALPFMVALAIVATVEMATSRAFLALIGLTGATILLWQPFTVPRLGVSAYFSMYWPGTASAPIALGGLVLIVTALICVLRSGEIIARFQPLARSTGSASR
jgi:hypothetical protein